MARITRTAVVLVTAATSVYPGYAGPATAAHAAVKGAAPTSDATGVRLLDDANDPFAAPAAIEPATRPAANSGQSVTGTVVNATASGNVEIHVNEANILEVLRMLSLQSQRNIVASRDVKGTVTANLYDVTVTEALAAILKQNDLISVEEGPVVYVYTRKEYQEVQKANRRTATEVFAMHYVPVADAERMVKNLLSVDGKTVVTAAAKGGVGFDNATAGGDDAAGASLLVVTDYEENLVNVRKLIEEVDVRPTQVLVEATILRASLTEDNALGVDFTVLGGVDFSTINTSNGQFTGAGVADGAALGNRNSSVGTGNNFSNSINGGLKVGFVTNSVSLFLSALEETTDTAVLANPKVLVLNKQKGEVKVVRKDPFRGAIVFDATGQSRQEVEIQETGTKLVFRPYVGNDGYVRLEIHPEDSTALPARAADLPPSQLSTEATTNVMVKDGRTIVIGGLFRESSSTTRSQIPFLGDIPVLGNLFRKKADSTVREEIIILLTPHIVKDDEAYSRLSEKEAHDAERIRVGVRRGMMPWGRERLAESAYEAATRELAKPRPNRRRAMWHLDIATNLNPKFLEAIDLKERVSGKVVTAVDNSSIRSFVRQQIMVDPALTAGAAGEIDGMPASTPMTLRSPTTARENADAALAMAGTTTTQPTTGPSPVTAATDAQVAPPDFAPISSATDGLPVTAVTVEGLPTGAVAPLEVREVFDVEAATAQPIVTEVPLIPIPLNEIEVTTVTTPTVGKIGSGVFEVTELPTEDVVPATGR